MTLVALLLFLQVQAPQVSEPPGQETELADIIVSGRPLREATADFVRQVVATPRGSGAATWNRHLCIGIANLRGPTAEYIVDRISDVAESVGLQIDRPGCEPRVFILFSADADDAANQIADTQITRFRVDLTGSDLGDSALEAFRHSDRPVRWWQVSVIVDPQTGSSTQRLSGSAPFAPQNELSRPADFGPRGMTTGASLLRKPERDDLAQVIVVVDVDEISEVSIDQLSAYLAMISLAQINPGVGDLPYDSVLGIFDGGTAAGLTDWDHAYLTALHSAQQTGTTSGARLGAVADAMASQVRRGLSEAE